MADGATVWLTGLPGSGKTTIARALEAAMSDRGQSALVLDGDDLRTGLSADLGFSEADRGEQARRASEVAILLAERGIVAIVALVSPYAAAREAARRRHEAAGVRFVEVHVDTPIDECVRRDPKGLYACSHTGVVEGLTGVAAPYEEPAAPEVRCDGRSVGDVVAEILSVIGPPARRGMTFRRVRSARRPAVPRRMS